MNESGDRDERPRATSRMETDAVLDRWARTARQADRNAVHKALFAILDGSVLRTYRVVEDAQLPNELYIIVKDDLVLKVRVADVNDFSSFEIVGIGPRDFFSTSQDGQHTS